MVFTAPNTNPSKDEHSELYSSTEKYPFELSSWQLWTILSLMQGKNALTCAPTGSGKTLAADWAIEYFVKVLGKKVIYIQIYHLELLLEIKKIILTLTALFALQNVYVITYLLVKVMRRPPH